MDSVLTHTFVHNPKGMTNKFMSFVIFVLRFHSVTGEHNEHAFVQLKKEHQKPIVMLLAATSKRLLSDSLVRVNVWLPPGEKQAAPRAAKPKNSLQNHYILMLYGQTSRCVIQRSE